MLFNFIYLTENILFDLNTYKNIFILITVTVK